MVEIVIEVLDSESVQDGDVVVLYMPEGSLATPDTTLGFKEWAAKRGLKRCMFIISHNRGAFLEKLSTANYETEAELLRRQADVLEQRAQSAG